MRREVVSGRYLVSVVRAAAVVFVLAACGGDAHTGAELRPFSAVQVGETEVEILPRGTAAVIRLTTDPPTVCAVAFGEDESLGQIANDPGMGGTAISEHAVVLRDLRPDITYYYRLTATDAAGAVYQTSSTLTFRTKPPPGEAAAGRNVATQARVADVSSEWSAAFAAANALDGDLTTEWSSAGDGNDAWLTIDLGRAVDLSGVAFRTRGMADGSAVTRTYSVVLDDGKRLGPFPAGNRITSTVASISARARLVRFQVESSTGGNTGAVEVEVYAR